MAWEVILQDNCCVKIGLMEKSILKTLAYADIFSFPLKKDEIWQRLIWQKKTRPAFYEFEKCLKNLSKKDIKKDKDFFFILKNNKAITLRKKREEYSKKKFKKARKISFFLKIIPTIKAVCITGSLACSNSKKQDDIDFLIISKKGTLWLTRLITTALLSALCLRRKPNDKKVKDKICLNIFLDESAFLFPEKERNLFSANEISNIKVLWERKNVFKKFKRKNLWVKQYLPNWNL
jgi:predicted nucleotidyltransferase